MPLNDRESVFVDAYLCEPNATRAAVAAGYAPTYGRRVRWDKEVAAAIAKGQAARAEKLGVTADAVVEFLAQIAMTNAGEMIEHQRVNCRHCHGRDHHRQLTKPEMLERWEKGLDPVDPNNAGVFDPWGDPNRDCPACGGLGEVAAFAKDSRYLSPAGQAIYAGLKQTPRGPELVLPDRVKALVHLVRYLGLFERGHGQGERALTLEEALEQMR